MAGVDVGGPKKGFHAVALRNGRFFEKLATRDPAHVVQWCLALHARAVGVDAPCCWSLSGGARPCERELARAGITAFSTPGLTVGQRHPFYGWMLNGAELFRLLTRHYRLFDGRSALSRPICFETFPHAAACALAGTILSAKRKRRDRPRLLRRAGLSLDALLNIDEADAALCALTADYLRAGRFKTYGDASEGFILIPAP